MMIEEQIKEYIRSQHEPKRAEIEMVHKRILRLLPKCKQATVYDLQVDWDGRTETILSKKVK